MVTQDAGRRIRASIGPAFLEGGWALVLIGLYYLGRALPPDRVELATRNARRIIDLERTLGVFWEDDWHRFAIEHDVLSSVSEFVYSFLHFPVLGAFAIVAFFVEPRTYRALRNALVLSAIVGLLFYWLVPVTPPRLLADAGYDIGFTDPIGGERIKPGMFTNEYAAIPSYHFGWILLMVMGVFRLTRSPVARCVSVLFLAVMTASIVATANHYFLDFVLGGVIVLLCLQLALRFEAWVERDSPGARRFTRRHGPMRFPC